MATVRPVIDNKGGSYLTMFSKGGLIFGIINVIGNFGTVFVDQAYWMGAISAKPSASYKVLRCLVKSNMPHILYSSCDHCGVSYPYEHKP